jgi:hypothetical protein
MRSSLIVPVVVVACSLASSGCWENMGIPESAPTIRGTIRGPGDFAGSLHVVRGTTGDCSIADEAEVVVGSKTDIRRRSGGSANARDLVVGTVVSVWSTGPSLEQCPGIIGAKTVVVEQGPP